MNRYSIIIVENDEDEQFFMKEAFDASGLFELVAILSDGEELIDWLDLHPGSLPQLVLSDLNMPGRNGYDILHDLSTTPAYQQIPVIITSTSSTRSIIDKCLSMGAADYMVKPETFVEYPVYIEKLHERLMNRHVSGQW